MSRTQASILTALVAIAVTAAFLHLRDRRAADAAGALRAEIADLHARAGHNAPANIAPPVRAPGADRGEGRPHPVAGESAPQQAPAPIPIYRDEGQETPRAALQTFAWACDRGDTARVAQLIRFDDEARAKATAWFDTLPAEARQRWASLDEMAAGAITMSGMRAPFPAADLLESAQLEEIGPDRVRLDLNGAPHHGSEFQRTADGWKHVITVDMVERYIREASEMLVHREGR